MPESVFENCSTRQGNPSPQVLFFCPLISNFAAGALV
jgi:hypothetical protein